MRRDRKRLRNWLLLCLLLAGLITLTVKRIEKGTGWQKISSVEENEQAILVDRAENLSMDTEQRTGEEWLPDLLLTELGASFGPEVWKVQSVLARTWLWNLANEHDKAGDGWEKVFFP